MPPIIGAIAEGAAAAAGRGAAAAGSAAAKGAAAAGESMAGAATSAAGGAVGGAARAGVATVGGTFAGGIAAAEGGSAVATESAAGETMFGKPIKNRAQINETSGSDEDEEEKKKRQRIENNFFQARVQSGNRNPLQRGIQPARTTKEFVENNIERGQDFGGKDSVRRAIGRVQTAVPKTTKQFDERNIQRGQDFGGKNSFATNVQQIQDIVPKTTDQFTKQNIERKLLDTGQIQQNTAKEELARMNANGNTPTNTEKSKGEKVEDRVVGKIQSKEGEMAAKALGPEAVIARKFALKAVETLRKRKKKNEGKIQNRATLGFKVALYGISITVDIVQIVLDIFAVGLAANRVIDLVAAVLLAGTMLLKGLDPFDHLKLYASILGVFIVEEIPIVDIAPFWTLDAWYIIGAIKKEDAEHNARIYEAEAENKRNEQRITLIRQREQRQQQENQAAAQQEQQVDSIIRQYQTTQQSQTPQTVGRLTERIPTNSKKAVLDSVVSNN